MRWLKPNLRSVYGLLGQSGPGGPMSVKLRTDAIRAAMLEAISACEPEPDGQQAVTIRRIRYADNIQSLWYARSELMAALADLRGEAYARAQVASISTLFDGLLPQGLSRKTDSRF